MSLDNVKNVKTKSINLCTIKHTEHSPRVSCKLTKCYLLDFTFSVNLFVVALKIVDVGFLSLNLPFLNTLLNCSFNISLFRIHRSQVFISCFIDFLVVSSLEDDICRHLIQLSLKEQTADCSLIGSCKEFVFKTLVFVKFPYYDYFKYCCL